MYSIVTFPNPILTTPAQPVEDTAFYEGQIEEIVSNMQATLPTYGGIGLAAPQVGISKRILIVDQETINSIGKRNREHKFLAIVNPEIVFLSETVDTDYEGCLSFPGVKALIPRHCEIGISYADEKGEKCNLRAKGLLSRCLQHEIDHLNGILMPDRLTGVDKLRFLSDYKTRHGKA